MLGYDEPEASHYGLLSQATPKRVSWESKAGALGIGIFLGAVVGALAFRTPTPVPTVAAVSITDVAAAAEKDAAAPVCATTPFGKCALNLTAFGANSSFDCCPANFQCVMMGPIFGMCFPGAWSPAAVVALATSPDARFTPEMDVLKKSSSESSGGAAPAPACATKPFGQCSGINATGTKADWSTFNFSKAAAPSVPFRCCPAGTDCVSYGPAWGMCMPDWGKPI